MEAARRQDLQRWELPRSVPMDQWLRELSDGKTPPPGSDSQRSNFTADRHELCILGVRAMDEAVEEIGRRCSVAQRVQTALRAQAICSCLLELLVAPRSVVATEILRERLAAAGVSVP